MPSQPFGTRAESCANVGISPTDGSVLGHSVTRSETAGSGSLLRMKVLMRQKPARYSAETTHAVPVGSPLILFHPPQQDGPGILNNGVACQGSVRACVWLRWCSSDKACDGIGDLGDTLLPSSCNIPREVVSHGMCVQVEAHHYCGHLNEEVRQCVIYDSGEDKARLIGIEYIISRRLFESLPEEEKKMWHSHQYEASTVLAPSAH